MGNMVFGSNVLILIISGHHCLQTIVLLIDAIRNILLGGNGESVGEVMSLRELMLLRYVLNVPSSKRDIG